VSVPVHFHFCIVFLEKHNTTVQEWVGNFILIAF